MFICFVVLSFFFCCFVLTTCLSKKKSKEERTLSGSVSLETPTSDYLGETAFFSDGLWDIESSPGLYDGRLFT